VKVDRFTRATMIIGLGFAAISGAPVVAHAAGPVANYVLSPSPIAPAGSLAANATKAVTLTAVDSTNTPVPGSTVYLTFKHTLTGGGSAAVGTTTLTLKPQAFVADTGGHVAITYHTPSTLPSNGEDVISAQNVASHATIRVRDHYTFVGVKRYAMNPRPIAVTASLAGNASVVVTLTALNSSHAGVPGAVVYLSISQAAGGGSAAVGTKALTSTPVAFTANSSGVISITYKTPAAPPTSGVDTINAGSAPADSIVFASDTYTF
jgi:hypothetical protein